MTAAGRPPSTPAANANGHHHPTWITAKPESTTTTAPKHSSDHPKKTTPVSRRGSWIQATLPAGPNHPTTKPPDPHTPAHMAARGALPRACSSPLLDLDRVLIRPTDDYRVTTLQAVEL